MSDQGDPMLTKQIKIQNQIKRNPRRNGATRCLPTQVVQALKSRSVCKNSDKIWWMTKFQNMETLTPVLHTIYSIGRKTSWWIYVVRVKDQRESSLHPGQIIYGQSSGNQWESTPSWRRSKSGRMKSSIWITHENCEGSISLTRRIRNFKETIKNARKNLETSVAPAMPCKIIKKNCGCGASNKN